MLKTKIFFPFDVFPIGSLFIVCQCTTSVRTYHLYFNSTSIHSLGNITLTLLIKHLK